MRSRGRRRIAFLGNISPSSQRRELGYRAAIEDDEPRITEAEPTADGGLVGTRDVLARWPDTDGIFAYDDLMAMAALRVF